MSALAPGWSMSGGEERAVTPMKPPPVVSVGAAAVPVMLETFRKPAGLL